MGIIMKISINKLAFSRSILTHVFKETFSLNQQLRPNINYLSTNFDRVIKYFHHICRYKNIVHKLLFILIIHGMFGLQQVYAATYYVSPTGLYGNNGTSLSTPLPTISAALNKASNSGDIIYVMTGTYVETVNIAQSGITLSAYPNNSPVIDGQTTLPNGDWGALISVNGNSNAISGFEVRNSNISGTYKGGYGIQVTGAHNVISNMKVHNIWQTGVLINGDYNTVQNSFVSQASLANSANPGTVNWASGLSAARNDSASALVPGIASFAILQGNTVFNNWGEGLSCYEAAHCTIQDNIVYDNWTVNLYLSDTTNSLVQRNIVYLSSQPAIPNRNNANIGILLADEVASVPRSANNVIVNNFLYNNNFGAFSWTGVSGSGLNNVLIAYNTLVDGHFSTGSGASIVNIGSQVRNNIFSGTGNSVPSNSGITFSNNNWGMTPPLAAAVTDIVGNPQLSLTGATTPGALTSAYFILSSTSPMRDAALPIASVPTDFFQFNRGAAPDIGGDQYNPDNSNKTVDTVPPSAPSSLTAAVNSNKVSLNWGASTDNVGVTGYNIYKNGTAIATSTVTSFTDPTAVVAGTTYSYTVKAYDAAGNISSVSNTVTITIPATTALNISSHSVVKITSNSATINWTTNVPATGNVSYSVISAAHAANGTGLNAVVGNAATSQSLNLTGLYNNTLYYYMITVKSGSLTTSTAVFTFKTALK